MSLDLRDVDVFLAVVRNGSFGRAAVELSMSQPAVSERVRHLERTVGEQLFARSARGAGLTPAGEVLLPYAERCGAIAAEAVEQVRSSTGVGELVVALHSTFAPRVLPMVLDALAGTPRRVRVRDAHSHEAEALVLDGIAHLAVVLHGPQRPGLRRVRLRDDPVVAVAAPEHPLARGRRRSLAALRDAVVAVNAWGDGHERFLSRVTAAGVEEWRVRRCGDAATATALARSHDHVGFVTESSVGPDLAAGTLRRLRFADMPRWSVRLDALARRDAGPVIEHVLTEVGA